MNIVTPIYTESNNSITRPGGYEGRKKGNMRNYNHLANIELVNRFENICFRITNYPNNKAYNKKFQSLRKELIRRLGEKEK